MENTWKSWGVSTEDPPRFDRLSAFSLLKNCHFDSNIYKKQNICCEHAVPTSTSSKAPKTCCWQWGFSFHPGTISSTHIISTRHLSRPFSRIQHHPFPDQISTMKRYISHNAHISSYIIIYLQYYNIILYIYIYIDYYHYYFFCLLLFIIYHY